MKLIEEETPQSLLSSAAERQGNLFFFSLPVHQEQCFHEIQQYGPVLVLRQFQIATDVPKASFSVFAALFVAHR